MRNAWSFFWLLVAIIIAITVLAAIVQQYLGVIIAVVSVAVLLFIGWKVYVYIASGRSRY